ncbi:UDP-glycosyltransferase 73C3-like [Prosopis cineraria]|uniref:UDP-glycosyltransferase 73C3-like n=1 Tax=Prosopis cineraria TaxID=364024 RepID=UPI00240F95CE|nr:UDP-glycosyltransferase 73C3-like [Prosopis cineraria]
MAYKPELHFLVIPLMAPGHLLPMVDMARLLARRHVKVTIVTTPLNAARVSANIDREIQLGSPIQIQLIRFPNAGSGIPEGHESVDTLPSMDLQGNFFRALCLLQHPLEDLFEKLDPTPDCIISDRYVLPAADVARKFQVPRIIFDGTSCFFLLCNHCLHDSKVYKNVSDSEPFFVPGLPDRIEFKKYQLPGAFNPNAKNQGLNIAREMVRESEGDAFGTLVNSFQELEARYVQEYKKVTGKKVWCIGPVSLSNETNLDKAQRGKNDSNDNEEAGHYYTKWLDSWPARSVIYVCLGSLNRVTPEQLMELGLGLEATERPFIWVLRGAYKRDEAEKLLSEDGLEERVKGRGILIRGWAPQVLILSHAAIGAFLTHCGWNSTLEGICSGVPLITFPLFGEQFYNEKVIVQVVQTGVRVGCERVVHLGEEEDFGAVQVRREQVKEAVEKALGEDEDSRRIRERARLLAEKAEKAVEKGGSSFLDMSLLIDDITQHVKGLKMNNGAKSHDSAKINA